LLALGEEGITVTPLEMLHAYRGLALRQVQGDRSLEWQVISQGLRSSADFGMGHAAQTADFAVAGKTGTAGSTTTTHGWFVGYAPADHPAIALVVYLEQGRGMDAAAVAGKIFSAYRGARGAH
jgi:cell division protein FtsI/penicillin-binding protein 2